MMQVYEELMANYPYLDFKFDPLMPSKHKGMIMGKTVYINPNQEYKELNVTVAEEIAHYLTGSGNIIAQDSIEKRKQERLARDIGAAILVTPKDIIDCFETGCKSVWECAEHLNITDQAFKDAVKFYARKFRGIMTEDNHIIIFREDGTVSVFKSVQ